MAGRGPAVKGQEGEAAALPSLGETFDEYDEAELLGER
jgi:hypothetical protein